MSNATNKIEPGSRQQPSICEAIIEDLRQNPGDWSVYAGVCLVKGEHLMVCIDGKRMALPFEHNFSSLERRRLRRVIRQWTRDYLQKELNKK